MKFTSFVPHSPSRLFIKTMSSPNVGLVKLVMRYILNLRHDKPKIGTIKMDQDFRMSRIGWLWLVTRIRHLHWKWDYDSCTKVKPV